MHVGCDRATVTSRSSRVVKMPPLAAVNGVRLTLRSSNVVVFGVSKVAGDTASKASAMVDEPSVESGLSFDRNV